MQCFVCHRTRVFRDTGFLGFVGLIRIPGFWVFCGFGVCTVYRLHRLSRV